jgi:hypothetical protein
MSILSKEEMIKFTSLSAAAHITSFDYDPDGIFKDDQLTALCYYMRVHELPTSILRRYFEGPQLYAEINAWLRHHEQLLKKKTTQSFWKCTLCSCRTSTAWKAILAFCLTAIKYTIPLEKQLEGVRIYCGQPSSLAL